MPVGKMRLVCISPVPQPQPTPSILFAPLFSARIHSHVSGNFRNVFGSRHTSALLVQSPIHCACPLKTTSSAGATKRALCACSLACPRSPLPVGVSGAAVDPSCLSAGVCFAGCSYFFSSRRVPSPLSAMLSSLSLLRRAAPSLRRAASSSPTAYTYARHGHPSTVISPSTEPAAAAPSADQVAVSFLAAGVDAGDVAAVLGVDGGAGKAPFPRVAGHGGVALVTQVGSSVTGLKEGDYVVPAKVRACGGLTARAGLLRVVLALGPRVRELAVVWIAREPLVQARCLCLS